MKKDKVLPTEAAAIMGASAQFVRIGIQQGILPIGCAVKMFSIWTYNISKERLEAYLGRNIEQELNQLRQNKGE